MKVIIKDLGEELVLRRSNRDDLEELVSFNKTIHAEDEMDAIGLDAWTRDLMSGAHPNFKVDDFTVVEDTQSGKIVSTMNLISQTWSYEGIPFGVGRPELVGTLPEYRGKGLVRQQFDVIHQWSAERGELVQAITGIPWYYRQFGYEMTMNLDGGRAGYIPGVVALKADEEENYVIRKATLIDIPFINKLYNEGCQRDEVSTIWTEELWRYELEGKLPLNINARQLYMIEDLDGKAWGFLAVPGVKWRNMIAITAYELVKGANWFKITPAVVRWVWQLGEQQAKEQNLKQQAFGFWLGEEHPVYQVYGEYLPRIRSSYAWYLRVPDLAKFLVHISPALNTRLENSLLCSYTGAISLSFYRSGLKLTFQDGKLVAAENLEGKGLKDCNAEFTGLTFLQLVFGWRTLAELRHAFTDVLVNGTDETRLLLETLFPKRASNLWPIS